MDATSNAVTADNTTTTAKPVTTTYNAAYLEYYASSLAMYSRFEIFGMIALVANVLCLIVFLTKKEIRETFVLFEFLALGDLLNGLGLFLAGYIRGSLILSQQYFKKNPWGCMSSYPWPSLYVLGGQLPSILLFIMGIERMVAIFNPIYYKKYVTIGTKIWLGLLACAIGLASMIIGWVVSYSRIHEDPNKGTTSCSLSKSTSDEFVIFNYSVVIIPTLISFVLNTIAYLKIRGKVGGADQVLINLVVSFFNLILTVIPHVVMLGLSFKILGSSFHQHLNLFYLGFCCKSTVNLLLYMWLKSNFRLHAIHLASCGRWKRGQDKNKISNIPAAGNTMGTKTNTVAVRMSAV